MARRPSRFTGSRGGNRYASVPQYDYGPAGAITTDFGQIGKDALEQQQKAMEIAGKARERIDKYEKEAQESQDYPYTGVASLDKATMNIAQKAKEGLFAAKQKIGTMQPDPDRPGKNKLFTIDDFASYKNNLINGSKIYKGTPELVQKQLEEFSKNENISGISSEGIIRTLGSRLGSAGAYNIGIDEYGNFKGASKDENGTKQNFDFKTMALNGVQEINKFDPVSDINEFKNVYAKTQKDFEIDGKTYDYKTVLGNELLFTRHVKKQSDDFNTALGQYVENFKNDDSKVISYLYDNLGKKLGDNAETDIVLDPDTGRFKITNDMREEAAKAYLKQVKGAFGEEEDVDVTVVRRRDSPTNKSQKPDKTIVGGRLGSISNKGASQAKNGQTMSTDDFDGRDLLQSAILGREHGLNQTPGSENYTQAFTTIQGKVQNMSYTSMAEELMAEPEFVQNNSDLIFQDEDGTGKLANISSGSKSDYTDTRSYSEQRELQDVGVTIDMSGTDLENIKLTSNGGQKFSSLSGFVFVTERVPGVDKDTGKTIVEEGDSGIPDFTKSRLVLKGVRAVGSVTYEESMSKEGVQADGSIVDTGLGSQAQSRVTGSATTNTLTNEQAQQIISKALDGSPALAARYEQLKNAKGAPTASEILYYLFSNQG